MGNREALLEAAIVCLRERGFGGTRARDLAQTAGVSLGAIRYHFGSTEALLNEAIAETSRRWIRGFKKSMCAPETSAGLATPARDLYDDFAVNRTLIAGFMEAFAHAQRSPAARTQLADYYDEFRREIARSLRDDDTADSVASLLIALADGLMVQWLLAPQRCPDADTVHRALAALMTLAAPANAS